jgi:hypothetical protein
MRDVALGRAVLQKNAAGATFGNAQPVANIVDAFSAARGA